jgi:DNA (cytosine-5)-methyltransferase 1
MKAVDLFAGWGGFTLGAEQAGVQVLWAANHWALAVHAHEANHPHALHVCQDLRQADWSALPEYDLLLASPACQPHSTASQPRRRHKRVVKQRATAWSVVDCAEVTDPRALIVENVPAFLRWPLYPRWRGCLEDLGYAVEERLLTASRFGVPQRRTRLFVVGIKTGLGRGLNLGFGLNPEPAFRPHVDWSAGTWKDVDNATINVRSRIDKGRRHGTRFLTQHVTGHPGVSLDEPIRTITTKDQWAVVDGQRYRPLTIKENAAAMGFPLGYGWPSTATRRDIVKGLGNAVCPPQAKRLVERVADAI